MQLQARPLTGHAVGNAGLDGMKVHAPQLRAFALPQRAGRGAVSIQAADNTAGLTSNSSLLGPSLTTGSSSMGLKSSGAKPAVSLADVPLASKVRSGKLSIFTIVFY